MHASHIHSQVWCHNSIFIKQVLHLVAPQEGLTSQKHEYLGTVGVLA